MSSSGVLNQLCTIKRGFYWYSKIRIELSFSDQVSNQKVRLHLQLLAASFRSSLLRFCSRLLRDGLKIHQHLQLRSSLNSPRATNYTVITLPYIPLQVFTSKHFQTPPCIILLDLRFNNLYKCVRCALYAVRCTLFDVIYFTFLNINPRTLV